jgi:hypothetical protein
MQGDVQTGAEVINPADMRVGCVYFLQISAWGDEMQPPGLDRPRNGAAARGGVVDACIAASGNRQA